jgi:hypothetical protein
LQPFAPRARIRVKARACSAMTSSVLSLKREGVSVAALPFPFRSKQSNLRPAWCRGLRYCTLRSGISCLAYWPYQFAASSTSLSPWAVRSSEQCPALRG